MLGGALRSNDIVLMEVDQDNVYNDRDLVTTKEVDFIGVECSPRSRSKAKAVLWLKSVLHDLGSTVFDTAQPGHQIDKCYQASLPPLQKLCAAFVRENRNSGNILNTMPFNKILRNICAVRSEYVMKVCKPILQKLMAHDRNRNVFNHPVDPVELCIPNYLTVIKAPMDLGTVMSNLRGGAYYTVKACMDDVELTFRNAMLFNPLPHEVHKMARDLLAELQNEVHLAEEKCLKESEKKSHHSCTLCCGSTCQLCGEKCLKFESPSLNCQQCGVRVKKNSFFFVCTDGSALWCQKCYIALPPVIVSAAPRPIHCADSSSVEGTTESAADLSFTTSSSSACNLDADGAGDHGCFDLLDLASSEPTCAISNSDADSLHGERACGRPQSGDHDSSGTAGAPLLKKQLLKRRADEELAEPWVACDSCGNWYHQICAMYSKLADTSGTAKSFCCPYCVVLVGCQQFGVDLEGCLSSVLPRRTIKEDPSSKLFASTPMDELIVPLDYVESADSVQRLKTQLAVKFKTPESLFKNIFEYSSLSPTNRSEAGEAVQVEMEESEDGDSFTVTIQAASQPNAHSSCVSTGSLSEGETLVRNCESDFESDVSCSGRPEEDHEQDQEEETNVMEDTSTIAIVRQPEWKPEHGTPMKTPIKTPFVAPWNLAPSPVAWRAQALMNATSTPVKAAPELDPHWKWRAASLPHTQLGDFLEQLVQDLLVTNGYSDAAARVTIRMTSNHDRALEVPASIVDNLVSPSGHCIPTVMGYKQKCILLFQEIDGVDVCLFSLYVHEFDANCPSPNTSTVYIAYLDSVDYFRPISARTMVYQEIVAGYLKWSQARGFKQAHIWSCPPHRGDNFIFNSHPVHQKYPSRERLNHWYKSILQRCSKLGIITETGNLWQQYFSKYVRRDVMPVARQAAKNSFVGSGKAVKKTNAKPKKKGGVLLSVPVPVPEVDPAAAATEEMVVDLTCAISVPIPVPVPVPVHISVPLIPASSHTDPSTDAPMCPPIFDGDYWVQQYVYLVRLHTQKSKAQSSAAHRLHHSVRKFREVLKRLMLREEGAPFLHPVDHIALDIPNYTLIVKQPMDFSTIKEKLGAGEYQTALHLVNDVRLVFMNAKLFNPPDHIVYAHAESLSQRFEKALKLALSELLELNGTGLLKMPIPQAGSGGGGLSMEQQLETIVLSTKFITVSGSVEIVSAVEEGTVSCEYASNTIVPRFGPRDLAFDCSSTSDGSSTSTVDTGTGTTAHASSEGENVSNEVLGGHSTGSAQTTSGDTDSPLEQVKVKQVEQVETRVVSAVYSTPSCSTVSRSGSLVDEHEVTPGRASLLTVEESGCRSRTQSISITPDISSSHPATHTPVVVKAETEMVEFSDMELESDPSERALQHVVSQDFGAGRVRLLEVDDQVKKKKLDWAGSYLSPESESKRRRVSLPSGDIAVAATVTQPTESEVSATHQDAALLASAMKSLEFRADTLNLSHRPVNFVAPALGSQNTMTIVAELSKRMQRQYDDLFVIKLAPPEICPLDLEPRQSSSSPTDSIIGELHTGVAAGASAAAKKPRGRLAVNAKRVPAMYLHGGLKGLSPGCRKLLRQLPTDTSDPDPTIHSPATDSRHTFLELCQFRHYQFDSLRRAKHSSLMLLFHLQQPLHKSCRPCCAHCDDTISSLRWHCDECPDFDLCGTCYAADQATSGTCGSTSTGAGAEVPASGSRSRAHSHSHSHNHSKEPTQAELSAQRPHLHPLTPYRVSMR